jgi:hypothetical protein
MKKMFSVLILGALSILLSMNAPYTYGMDDSGTEDYIMGDVSTLPANFFLEIKASSGSTDEYSSGVIVTDRFCNFMVIRSEADGNQAQFQLYDLFYFVDNKFSRMIKDRRLPATIKQNFRGIVDGDYNITFVARDEQGKIGKGSITLRVKH